MFNFFRRLANLGRFKQYNRALREISAVSSAAIYAAEVESMMEIFDKKRAIECEMFGAIAHDRNTAAIMNSHGATVSDLEDLYRWIMRGGGDQSVGEIYVPVAALFLPRTLSYVLDVYIGSNRQPDGKQIKDMVLRLLDWFEKGDPLPNRQE